MNTDLLNYIKHKLIMSFDPSALFVEKEELKNLKALHKGFYIGMVDSKGEDVARSGFLKEDLINVWDSANVVIDTLCSQLKNKNVTLNQVHTSSFYTTLILDVVYIQNPTHWDENKDGVYLQWGQNYKGLYLPYQIKRMNIPKIEIMDRLCGWELGIASNLWKKPEGLVFRIICSTFPEI